MTTETIKGGIGLQGITNAARNEIDIVNRERQEFLSKPISYVKRNLLFVVFAAIFLFIIGGALVGIIKGIAALFFVFFTVVTFGFSLKLIRECDPYISQKIKNKVWAARVAEAKNNESVQLDNYLRGLRDKLAAYKVGRDKMGAGLENLKTEIRNDDDVDSAIYKQKQEMYSRLSGAYDIVKLNVETYSAAFDKAEKKVRDYKGLQAFSEQAQSVLAIFKSLDQSSDEEMLANVAFGQIDSEINEVVVAIENNIKEIK